MYNSNLLRITRLKDRPKGVLIPVDDYCLKPIYEDKYSKYIGSSVIASDIDGIQQVGPYQKVLKEYCSICGGSVTSRLSGNPPANTQDEDFNGSAKSMPELTAQQHQET